MLSADRLDRLARLLHERVGLYVRPEGRGSLQLALSARLGTGVTDADVDGYLDQLEGSEEELRALLPLVTVGKTSFFRDDRQFAALQGLLPELLATARGQGRKLSIWSAGCATGEEPWSLAIAALEAGAEPPELELRASDVNPAAVAFARAGRYGRSRLEGLDGARLVRHFDEEDGAFSVKAHLRRTVTSFEMHNLAQPDYPLPQCGAWDAIFCRNVLIYFDVPTAQAVLDRFHQALRPGGWLFLGYSESLFRVYDGFDLVERAGAFLYRKPRDARAQSVAPAATAGPVRIVQGPAAPPPPVIAPASVPPPVDTPRESFFPERIADRIARGEFEPARAELETRLATFPEDLGARLTLGNLYVLLRLPDEARACYEAALSMEPLRAETHLFYGIHLLAQGDLAGAEAELSRAQFLEPELALAHYFLGRCRERDADLDGARRSYRNAIRAFREARQKPRFVGFYPDLPEDGSAVARAAESALAAL